MKLHAGDVHGPCWQHPIREFPWRNPFQFQPAKTPAWLCSPVAEGRPQRLGLWWDWSDRGLHYQLPVVKSVLSWAIWQSIYQTYSILGQDGAEWLKWKVFGRSLDNQTHLLGIVKAIHIGKIQLPVVLAWDVVNAKDLSRTREHNQHFVEAKGVTNQASSLSGRGRRTKTNDMKEQASDLNSLCGYASQEGADNVSCLRGESDDQDKL